MRDTITVRLDAERFEQVQQNALVYQGGIILPPGNYKLKFLARENETGRIGTFEDEFKLPAVKPDRLQLSSVVLSSQLVEVQKNSEVQTKGFAPDAKLKDLPLDVGRRAHHSQRDARLHQPADALHFLSGLRAGQSRSQSFARRPRIFPQRRAHQPDSHGRPRPSGRENAHRFFPHQPAADDVAIGRYTVEAVVVEAGGAQAAFGRNYFALRPPVAPFSFGYACSVRFRRKLT